MEERTAERSKGRLWTTPKAWGLHAALVFATCLCAAAFIWQVERVRQGNELSWVYVFEWPLFAAYAAYLWWRLVHEQGTGDEQAGAGRPQRAQTGRRAERRARRDAEAAEELTAYNRYLSDLADHDR